MPRFKDSDKQQWKNVLFPLFVALTISFVNIQKGFADGNWQLPPTSSSSYAQNIDRGVKLYERGDYEGAYDAFTQAKNLDPKEPYIHRGLAKTLSKLHRYSEAESEYQTVITLEPTNLANKTDLGALYLDEGKFQNANTIFQSVLAQDADNSAALWGKGVSLEATDDLDGATECYQQLIKEKPNSTEANIAQAKLQHIEKAKLAETNNRFFPIDAGIGESGFGWWNLEHMPLHVYVDNGDGVPGYRAEMKTAVQKAIDAWTQASNGAITFVMDVNDFKDEDAWKAMDAAQPILARIAVNEANMPPDPVPCDIHIHWLPLSGIDHGALGRTWTSKLQTGYPVLNKAHIWLVTNALADGSVIPDSFSSEAIALYEAQDRMLNEVVTHEMGHALGLPHSPNSNDLMFGGVYGLNARDMLEERQLSSRDQKSLAEHYNNFEGTGFPALASNGKLLDESSPQPAPDGGGANGGGGNTPDANPAPAPDTNPAPAPDNNPPATGDNNPAPGPDNGQGAETNPDNGQAGATAGGDTDKTEAQGDEDKSQDNGEDKNKDEEESKSSASANVPYNPLKAAMFDLNSKHYNKCLQTLDSVIATAPNNVEAHYLKAVAYVMLRQYGNAASEYKTVLHLAPGSPLSAKAAAGLKNIKP